MQWTLATLQEEIATSDYVADTDFVTSLWLMGELNRPLLIEGAAGVGKTEAGKMLADVLDRPLLRLQCYEGLDVNTAVYEWNYQRQLLAIRRTETSAEGTIEESELFGNTYLLERPLLQAITADNPTVLLIDEIDRADEEFEAYLLEVLAEYQISIPELGTIKARSIPRIVLTSNGTRELSDALRRRCLFHYLDYPDYNKEVRIIMTRLPHIGASLASQIASFVQNLRKEDLNKKPGIAETLDWAAALCSLETKSIGDNPEAVMASLGCLLKTRADSESLPEHLVKQLLAKAS